MTRQAVRMLGVTMCAVAILAVSTKATAQAPKPPATGLEAVVGVYQGTVDARRGKAPIACELRLANGQVTGTLQPGDDALAVTGASLAGNTLTLNLDINGNDVPLTIAIVPTVTVLDVYDNIASVLLTSASNIRYCHLARQNGRWRIVNMLSR